MKKLNSIFALLVVVGTASTARAGGLEIDTDAFAGGHFFSTNNRLGRGGNSPGTNALDDSALFGFRVAFKPHPRFAIETELGLAPTSTKDGSASVLAIGFRAHALVNLLIGRVRPFLVAGGGGFTSSSSNPDVLRQETKGELHLGAGLAVDIGCNYGMRLDGRVQFGSASRGSIAEDGEVTIGFYGRFGKPIVEKCRKVEPKAPIAAQPPPPDRDGDGTVDAVDQCIDKAGPRENHGCPWPDTDGDGLDDGIDKCPKEVGPKENNGCPDTDKDKDGVVDRLDKCPEIAGPADNKGCPWPDNDNDGITNNLDKCVDAAETRNGFEDDDGCPDEIPADLKAVIGTVKGLDYVANRAQFVKPTSPALDAVAKTLAKYPSVKVEIGVHTDDTGVREKNLELSQQRADLVRGYVAAHGVEGTRLTAKGYGPDMPIGDNKTKVGKAQNRRTEITIVIVPVKLTN